MYDEHATYEFLSFDYCRTNFGHYANFALLPLHLGLVKDDRGYTYSDVRYAFRISGEDHEGKPYLAFMKNLEYNDSDFFTTEETRFFLRIETDFIPRSDEGIEADRKKLLKEAEHANHMFRSHAQHLLRAIEYWKLRCSEKRTEWIKEFNELDIQQRLRAQFINGKISPGEFERGVIMHDEGYCTDYDYMSDSDEGDEWENFGFMD
jgi:hypothetical protein